MHGWASRIPNDEGKRLSESGASNFPQGRVIVFPLEGTRSRKMAAAIYYILALGTQHPFPHTTPCKLPTPDSPHMALDCTALPLSDPRVSDWEYETCALVP